MDGVKSWLSDRGPTIPEAKESVKDRKEWRCMLGTMYMIQGEAGCMLKQLKLWMYGSASLWDLTHLKDKSVM